MIFDNSYRSVSKGIIGFCTVIIVLSKFNFSYSGFQILSGGSLGINIIFFLSGFLVTKHFLYEFQLNKIISLSDFYKKIFGALFYLSITLIILTLIFGYKYLIPIYYENLSKSALSILFLISNFYFHYSKLLMFWQNDLLIPLEHFWAISLWLQFFIFFPIFFSFILIFFKRYLTLLLITGIILSFLFSSWAFKTHSSFNFYMLPSHIWEFLLGSLLANMIFSKKFKINFNRTFSEILVFFFLLVLILSFFIFDNTKQHPSYFTLPIILSVFGILLFSKNSKISNNLFKNNIFTFFGSISLSLYLCSHIIISFIRINDENNIGELNLSYFLLIVIISFLYHLIFQKIRLSQLNISNIKQKIFFSLLIIIFLGFNFINISLNGFQKRLPDKLNIELIDDRFVNVELSIKCMRKFNDNDEFCEYNKNEEKKIFLIGDSIIDSITYDLASREELKKFNIVLMAKPGCYFWRFGARRCYLNYNEKRNKKILENNNSIIIIGGALWVYLDNNQIDKKQFKDSLNKFIEKGHKIIFLYPLPIFEENVLEKISYLYLNGEKDIETITISYNDFLKKTKNSFDFLSSLKNSKITNIFPHELFCDKISLECKANKKDDIYFVDNSHPSIFGSQIINDLIVAEIKKIDN